MYLKIFVLLFSLIVFWGCNNTKDRNMNKELSEYIEKSITEFDSIPEERKAELKSVSKFIQEKFKKKEEINLIFICTHNSRRSHISQLLAQAAAYYYGIPKVNCYSGGTEATAFNIRSVKALRKAGFDIQESESGANPVYICSFADDAKKIKAFSKKYDDKFNPNKNFAAVMVCSHADENCPYVVGAIERFSLPYDDPKEFDGTNIEEQKYDERTKQISREIFYLFSIIN